MTHPRTDIRDAIVTLLSNKITVAGVAVPVEATRILPEAAANLPRVCLYCNSEAIEKYNESPRVLKRILSLSIEIIQKASSKLEDDLDALALQVEHELMQDHTLDDTCSDIIETASEITIDGHGDECIGSCVLSYDVTYFTFALADAIEANNVNNLLTVDVKYILPDEDETGKDSAEDEIDLSQT